ncbi:hypothetical protein CIRG_06369 [Coccidioides immitis RMSCC 2394]|uniref:Uncharacterized protein n=1 Tax=Coccidioides immitis RMSCC 2394 TaxID=404692 RepID=A0A0J6YIE8_COCIT|nr:hypothetical protein CIRG_06369 [Coccidioides immitis RMSCC 2394]
MPNTMNPDHKATAALTPSNTPTTRALEQYITREELRSLLIEVLEMKRSSPGSSSASRSTISENGNKKNQEKGRIVNSSPAQDMSELDKYVFIVHKQIYNKTSAITTYINIKSSGLQDILRAILKDIRTADLGIDKPVVKQDLLYHFLPKLRKYSSPCAVQNDQGDEAMAHQDLLVQHLKKYQGHLFVSQKNRLVKIQVNSGIMVDAGLFHKMNPNYTRLETKKSHVTDLFSEVLESKTINRIQSNGIDSREFAVENIKKIRFSNSPFNMLTIPEDKKTVIKSLIESHVHATNTVHFDNIIKGKRQGVIILLQFHHLSSEAKADVEESELSIFAEISLNGHQIKNVMKIAHEVFINSGAKLPDSNWVYYPYEGCSAI